MIKFHPSEQHLVLYTAGELSPAMLMMVGTHVDMCSHCQAVVKDIEQQLAQKLFGEATDGIQAPNILDEQAMLASIFNSKPSSANDSNSHATFNNNLFLDGQRFALPATLARNHHRIGDWNRLPGKLWRAPVRVGGDETLIFM